MEMLSIRRLTHDRRHNAFTGACWFKGDLYVGYRQGDDHVCDQGRIIIQAQSGQRHHLGHGACHARRR